MHWNEIEKIATELEKENPEEHIPEDNLLDLKELVLLLRDFEDHEVEVKDTTLRKIMECWLELRKDAA